MSEPDKKNVQPEIENPRTGPPDWLVVVLLTQAAAILIGLVSPLTPSKTGSTWSPADLFTTDPTYLEKVLASFLVVNIMIVVIGVLAWISIRWIRSK